jgi:CBS domain-containing protein
MPTARDIMTPEAAHLDTELSVSDAARCLSETGVGAMPVCDAEGRLTGMVTDRDLVVKVLAEGRDPSSTSLADLADQPEVVTIGADDPVDEILQTMTDHAVRRLPVIDGDQLVGVVSQADVARACPPERVGDVVESISASG